MQPRTAKLDLRQTSAKRGCRLTLRAVQAASTSAAPIVPPLQLPHSGVTWSEQLAGDTSRESGLAGQPSSSSKAAYKATASVSMYVDDGSKSLQVVEALREK